MSVQLFEKNKIVAPFLGEPLVHIVGQDPLGLLNTGGKTFDLLLPGLNNVTDRIRYYSFYCWFFHCYAKYIRKPSKKEQFDHLRRAEFILSLLAAKTGIQGIGGITKALELLVRANSTLNGVLQFILSIIKGSISFPGLSISEPYAKIPILYFVII